jgi:hypothetical protein
VGAFAAIAGIALAIWATNRGTEPATAVRDVRLSIYPAQWPTGTVHRDGLDQPDRQSAHVEAILVERDGYERAVAEEHRVTAPGVKRIPASLDHELPPACRQVERLDVHRVPGAARG